MPERTEHDGDEEIRFGKYSGYSIAIIPNSYLEWCIENIEPRTTRMSDDLDLMQKELVFRDENDIVMTHDPLD